MVKIATWNIAEGHRSRSTTRFDYEATDDIPYFIGQLGRVQPDIVCLQESRCNAARSVSREIAQGLGWSHWFETATHPSHINPEYSSSLAILSRLPFTRARALIQPYPTFDLVLPNGKPARRFDEYVQVVRFDGLMVANTKTQPLEFLGHAYESELGQEYARALSDMFSSSLAAPLIFAGDFNTPDPAQVFAPMLRRHSLADALPPLPTKPGYQGHLDCIFASDDFVVSDSGIIATETDHYVGWAELRGQG